MKPGNRVCPYCGEPPGPGVFCVACGRNLGAVERLPTRAEWDHARAPDTGDRSLAAECAEATATFLAAMQAAGNPGAKRIDTPKRSTFGRSGGIHGWVLREVDREDFREPRRYEPGVVLTVEGRFHQLDSELRGWGQRDFPSYRHTASAEPIGMPAESRLVEELAAARTANGVP